MPGSVSTRVSVRSLLTSLSIQLPSYFCQRCETRQDLEPAVLTSQVSIIQQWSAISTPEPSFRVERYLFLLEITLLMPLVYMITGTSSAMVDDSED